MAAVCRCNVLLQIVAWCVATLSDKMSGNTCTIGPIFVVRELKATCKRTQQLPTLSEVVAFVLAVVCKWTKQLPIMLGSAVHRGRLQPVRRCKPCVMRVHGPNSVGRAVQADAAL